MKNHNLSTTHLEKMSDKEIYKLCQKYGKQAKLWRQKFIGLLPEVNRRKIFEQKGFGSIFEFASKLAGLSHEQVRRALNIEKRFDKAGLEDLRDVFVKGEVSMHKLARVVSVATIENEGVLIDAVKDLSQSAIETYVRDESVRTHTFSFDLPQEKAKLDFELSDEVLDRLNELNSKGMDVNTILMELLDKREKELSEEKEDVAEDIIVNEEEKRKAGHEVGRNIPAKVKKVLKKEHGNKCSIPHCKKDSTVIHHVVRFGSHRSHDPRLLAPLCHQHHEIAHTLDVKYKRKRKSLM